MEETKDTQITNHLSKKEKIRQKYKGVDESALDFIPAKPKEDFYNDVNEKRVAVYARVSTDDPRQTSSYELQKNHYEDVVKRRDGWKLVEIYADEGISGTSLKKRDAFVRMINDCKEGKIDLILTKSVSRFARNVLDCIGYVRELAALDPPIGVFFETENIYTLNSNSEMSLSFISTLAQEESHNKSEIMNASIEMRFRRGIFLTPPLLGFDHDEEGNLIINEEEAKTVRLIFFMYLYGYTTQQIADMLTDLKRKTKRGNTNWSSSTVINVLQNERHCGDVLARKTFTPNYLDHKSKKNNHDRNQYRQTDHHQNIVSRDDFIAVQRLLSNAKYRNKGILPELHVIEEGALKGFIPINPRWSGFKAEHYKAAAELVPDTNEQTQVEVTAYSGDFDLRGYEIARGQFFGSKGQPSITFSYKDIRFNPACIKKFSSIKNVDLLIHPDNAVFAVRPSNPDSKNTVTWASQRNGEVKPKPVSGAAFLPTLYELLHWNPQYKYRAIGTFQEKDNESVIIFNLKEVELLIPNNVLLESEFDNTAYLNGTTKSTRAYPSSWADNFGNNYYLNSQPSELASFRNVLKWDIHNEGTPIHMDPPLRVTSMDEIGNYIDSIIESIKQENNYERNEQYA